VSLSVSLSVPVLLLSYFPVPVYRCCRCLCSIYGETVLGVGSTSGAGSPTDAGSTWGSGSELGRSLAAAGGYMDAGMGPTSSPFDAAMHTIRSGLGDLPPPRAIDTSLEPAVEDVAARRVYEIMVGLRNNHAAWLGPNDKLTRIKFEGGLASVLGIRMLWEQFSTLHVPAPLLLTNPLPGHRTHAPVRFLVAPQDSKGTSGTYTDRLSTASLLATHGDTLCYRSTFRRAAHA
jgi:hypothetical protein